MTEVLPEGFRFGVATIGGSGRGDELFALSLQRWETVTRRGGLFRRKVRRTGWVQVEHGSPFTSDDVNRACLVATAQMLMRND